MPGSSKAIVGALGVGVALGAMATAISQPIPIRTSLNITAYGAANNTDLGNSLLIALNDCAALGVPVYVPAGTYRVTKTTSWPTQNNNCPGISGDGPASVFQPVNFNGPVLSAVVQTGIVQSGKILKGLAVAPSWTTSGDAHDQSRLISITGASDGWAYSQFVDLTALGTKDLVLIGTNTLASGGYIMSNSGWNTFNRITMLTGSQGIKPDYGINFANSTSTGNVITNFISGAHDAFVYVGSGTDSGGNLFDVGDLVINSGQVGDGRALHIAGSTCAGYLRSMTINNVQVDASSIEVVKADCGIVSNLKLTGTFGGSTPWAGINYLTRSEVHDLGETSWGAGFKVTPPGTSGAHSLNLFTVSIATNSMARVEVALTGTFGNLGGGGSVYVFDIARGNGATIRADEVTALRKQEAPDTGASPPAGWPTISATPGTGNVGFFAAWTDTGTSTNPINTSLKSRHGDIKVVGGSATGY